MLLPAIVLETKDFATTGKIRVRIASKFFGQMYWNLADNPKTITDGTGFDTNGEEVQSDFFVHVFTPFGVGVNSSMFYLPKVNMTGVVAPMGFSGSNDYVWLGGFFRAMTSIEEDGSPVVNIPSDFVDESHNYGIVGGKYLLDSPDGFLWRTKTVPTIPRSLINSSDKEVIGRVINMLDWRNTNTENIIQVNEAKISFEHIETVDQLRVTSSQAFHMGSDYYENSKGQKIPNEGYIEFKNIGFLRTSKIKIDQANVCLEYHNNESENPVDGIIYCGNNGVVMSTTIEDKTVTLVQDKDGVVITYGETSFSLGEKNVKITAAETVYIDAKEVRLGNTDQKIVTTTSSLSSFKLADGLILSTSDRVFA